MNTLIKPPCCNNGLVPESQSVLVSTSTKNKRSALLEKCAEFKRKSSKAVHSLFTDTNCYYMGTHCKVEQILHDCTYGSWRDITSEIPDLLIKRADLDDHDCLRIDLSYKNKPNFYIEMDYYCNHRHAENKVMYSFVSEIVSSLEQLEYLLTMLYNYKVKFIFKLEFVDNIAKLGVLAQNTYTRESRTLVNKECVWPDENIGQLLNLSDILVDYAVRKNII